MQISDLPTVNATLNTISAILLTIGYVLIRQRRIEAHKRCMLAAKEKADTQIGYLPVC